ncbi:hypothetical protein Peur_006398 [Populus x canadensis]
MECSFCRRGLSFLVRAEQSSASSASHSQVRSGRRELIAASVIAPWEVVIEGQDKVFKDVIEPLESVAETLIKKVLAPPSQKTKLIEAKEHDADEKVYYTIESVAQAPNFTCHAPSAITIGSLLLSHVPCKTRMLVELQFPPRAVLRTIDCHTEFELRTGIKCSRPVKSLPRPKQLRWSFKHSSRQHNTTTRKWYNRKTVLSIY